MNTKVYLPIVSSEGPYFDVLGKIDDTSLCRDGVADKVEDTYSLFLSKLSLTLVAD